MPVPEKQYQTKIVPIRDLYDGEPLKSEHAIVVPEYQRDFNWDIDLVDRLYVSLLTGLFRDDQRDDFEPIFLGSWIICQVEHKNSVFKGEEYDLIDGQQRLTTLTILSFALIYSLLSKESFIEESSHLSIEQKQHLQTELGDLCEKLMRLLVGKLERRDTTYRFPRLVRDIDTRDADFVTATFKSPIAIFIKEAFSYYKKDKSNFSIKHLKQDATGERLVNCYDLLIEKISKISDTEFYDDSEATYASATKLTSRRYTDLLHSTPHPNRQKLIQTCVKDAELENILRIIFLGNFLQKFVGISLIKCTTMDAAFDIFDSLNSTGLPLSAIETFKPQVIKQFRSERYLSYDGSTAANSFDQINNIFKDYRSSKQQEESKKIVTAACYLLTGEKLPEKLFEQRKKLRTLQNEFSERSLHSAVPEALATITKFRHVFFSGSSEHIEGELRGLSHQKVDQIKVFCDLLSASRTILVIPSLARAWQVGLKYNDHNYFFSLLRSTTAFFALRRFASGGTDGIDTRFRNLISGGGSTSFTGFTIKKMADDELPSIAEINNYFRLQLSCKNLRFTTTDKEKWVNFVSQQAIYNFSKPLTKFLLITGHSDTQVDEDGIPTRHGVTKADDREFLTWANWKKDIYGTIEHVAPQQGVPSDWPNIYETNNLKNCLGNLVLLPGLQNSQIGNDSWSKKKLFFKILTETSVSNRQDALTEAERAGVKFKKDFANSLIHATKSSMLDGVSARDIWDAEYVQKRSKRLSGLCWDTFVEWLE